MTSSKMENSLWKQQINNGSVRSIGSSDSLIGLINETNLLNNDELTGLNYPSDNANLLPNSMLNKLISQPANFHNKANNISQNPQQQQQQPGIKQLQPFFSKTEQMYQDEQIGNFLISNDNFSSYSPSASFQNQQQQQQQQFNDPMLMGSTNSNGMAPREWGMVEKLIGSYGFVKCYDKDARLFFHYSSYQPSPYLSNNDATLKVGDLVEYEETFDKRNGKPVAINLTKRLSHREQLAQNQQQLQQQQSNTTMSLKDLLLKKNNSSPGMIKESNQFNQSQQQYQDFLKMLNMSNLPVNNQSSIMNLFNKENIFESKMMNEGLMNVLQHGSKNAQPTAVSPVGNDPSINLLAKMLNVNGILNKNEMISPDQIEGNVTVVASKRPANFNSATTSQFDGELTYKRNGETFFIRYSPTDLVALPNGQLPQLKCGDRVKFTIPQFYTGSSFYARKVELLSVDTAGSVAGSAESQYRQIYRGIITTLKDSFGKIEREDLFKETFFHFTEYRGKNADQELKLGLNVEFELQDRYGKEIACNIKMLPDGTVTFDELSANIYLGRIIQPLTPIKFFANLTGINLSGISAVGRLVYDKNGADENLVELYFTDRDRIPDSGEYTLLEGDFVQFRIASDKRKKTQASLNSLAQRATQLTLIEEHSLLENSANTNEHRERGVLVKILSCKELLQVDTQLNYGAIKCVEQNELVYFSFGEVISFVKFKSAQLPNGASAVSYTINEVDLQVGDSVEFTVVKCQKDQIYKNGLKAIRLIQLAKNSVQFEQVSTEQYTGVIERDLLCGDDLASVKYEPKPDGSSSSFKRVAFNSLSNSNENGQQSTLYFGDKIQFNVCTCLRSNKQTAVNVKLLEAGKETGVITMLKENYGFIEICSQIGVVPRQDKQTTTSRDIFFHFSSVSNTVNDLDVGDEVEFSINRKNRQKICAENLTKLTNNSTMKPNNLMSNILRGRVTQVLRSQAASSSGNNNHEQTQSQIDDAYYGKIQLITSPNDKKDVINENVYQFGLFSLSDRKLLVQVGDLVSFQVGTFNDGSKKAFNIQVQQSQQQQQQQETTSNASAQPQQSRRNDAKKGKVDSIKGHCGFIEYLNGSTNNEPKKVFFHVSDLIESAASELKVGDEVEFVLTHNSRNGKFSATKIKKSASASLSNTNNNGATNLASASNKLSANNLVDLDAQQKRPERLNTRLKIANIDDKSGKQLALIRQPLNPDSKIKSFSRVLNERTPGCLQDSQPSQLSILDLIVAGSN